MKLALGIVGALIGGVVGSLVFGLLANQGLYAMVCQVPRWVLAAPHYQRSNRSRWASLAPWEH